MVWQLILGEISEVPLIVWTGFRLNEAHGSVLLPLAFRYITCTMKHFRYRVSGMLARMRMVGAVASVLDQTDFTLGIAGCEAITGQKTLRRQELFKLLPWAFSSPNSWGWTNVRERSAVRFKSSCTENTRHG